MTDEILSPENCVTMAEVRAAIDSLDRRIVGLLAERLRYIDAAARVKTDRNAVRDEWRKADVLAKVASAARDNGLPADLAAMLYEQLIEYSIAHEFTRFDAKAG